MYQPEFDFSDFSFRSHYLGLLMTNPKGKTNLQKYNEANASYLDKEAKYKVANKDTKTAQNLLEGMNKLFKEMERLEPIKDVPLLSDTCKGKLHEIYTSTRTGREKNIKTKYMDKGLLMEEDGITAYCLSVMESLEKNVIRKNNGTVNGCCDIDDAANDTIIDTKCSWDIFTFDANKFKVINPIYDWQGLSYMWLYNRKKFKLAYILLNTPEHIVKKEISKLEYDFVGTELDLIEATKELRRMHNYDDLPAEDKIQIFETVRSDERIDMIKERLKDCRNYLCNIGKVIENETEEEETN